MISYCAKKIIKRYRKNIIIFSASIFLFNGHSYAQDVWKEIITLSIFTVEQLCEYNYATASFYARSKSYTYNGDAKYLIKLQSKYKMFANYNFDSLLGERIRISTDLHEISINRANLNSRADIEIHLNGNEFDKLIQADSFFVYYPSYLFDKEWKKKLAEKHFRLNTKKESDSYEGSFYIVQTPYVPIFSLSQNEIDSRLLFFSHLSTDGLSQARSNCYKTIVSQKINFDAQQDAQQKEDSKPANRLKKFFGI